MSTEPPPKSVGRGSFRRAVVPPDCGHNAHMYYILLDAGIDRQAVIEAINRRGVFPVFHYVPLHDSPGGRRYGRVSGDMSVTQSASGRLLRLPRWVGLTDEMQNVVVAALEAAVAPEC